LIALAMALLIISGEIDLSVAAIIALASTALWAWRCRPAPGRRVSC
jgi:rhamnose transport system permease protein